MVLAVVTRIPDLLPPNFSAVYALFFCAGVYFPGRTAWWLPALVFLGSDIVLNLFWYKGSQPFSGARLFFMLGNYAVYPVLVWLGRKFTPKASFVSLLGGGILGAILFYLITNTISWFFNPFGAVEYTKDLAGWIRALSLGSTGWPHTWEFFINTLTSGGLFTGLFAGAMKAAAAAEAAEEEEEEEEPETESEPEEAPENAKP